MDHDLTIRVSEDVFHALAREATAHGSPVESIASQVVADRFAHSRRSKLPPAEAHQRLLALLGSVDLAQPTGIDNESIDADLARAYEQHGE